MKAKDGSLLSYEQVTILMYTTDLEAVDKLVEKLKAAGNKQANRSALIRYALECVSVQSIETINAELNARRRMPR